MKKEAFVTVSWSMRVKLFVQSVGEGLSNLYSALLEEKISVSQSWKILNASVALMLTVFTDVAVEWRLVLVGWLLFALWDCRRSGLK